MIVSKSALWLTLTSILCLSCCTALAGKGNTGPVWKEIGGSITIQCKTTMKDSISMSLRWGLHEQVEILSAAKSTSNVTIKEDLKHRVKAKKNYPTLDIVIRNLTVEDTGAYWCLYKKLDSIDYSLKQEKGDGSVLLVVKGAALSCEDKDSSEKPPSTLVLMSVLTAGIVLLITFVLLFIWIIFKIKAIRGSPKPRRVNTNDVYEDMRGTIRR
ncbi:T-cell immunoreceptor with Ig and ITIM domains isoform X2 [Myripristis murdjan]|uniref:T-cell immunoreceptor with Ig and ITIM domains isoform X2 n=1 Tax=Myripristis murdjan TaxID=586833 RepID=UPI001175F049|nr:T-cell immunoreceptor with Ig and ITIM domains-like isoform X2 [Myripristis murdjan]